MCSLYYTAHHNWAWVLKEAIASICSSQLESHLTKRFSELHSQVTSKDKVSYALFRIEFERSGQAIVKSYATSLCFAYLDPKDTLYVELKSVSAESCMPQTVLLQWDNDEEVEAERFPTCPALLKAALGSGGFGLYFVYSSRDINEVIKGHKARAENVDGFLEGLRRDYGSVPCWSLQQLVPSVRVANQNRKCQLRAYVVECNGTLYLFHEYEVRIPCWDIDLDAVLVEELNRSKAGSHDHESEYRSDRWSYEVENECCGRGNARPYNEQRNKGKTERYLLDEIPELKGCRDAMTRVLRQSMTAMKDKILSRRSTNVHEGSASTMAIAGIDLLVSRKTASELDSDPSSSFNAYIVEINNNPAMPGPDKHMSEKYRQHLISLVSSILKLGLRVAAPEDKELISLIDPQDKSFRNWEAL